MSFLPDLTAYLEEHEKYAFECVSALPFLPTPKLFTQQPYNRFFPHFFYASLALQEVQACYASYAASILEGVMGYNLKEEGVDMNYFFKGKYLRSLLGILTYGICTDFMHIPLVERKPIDPLAFEKETLQEQQKTFIPYGLVTSLALVELTHMGSLILDDCIDNSRKRRGAKTLWVAVGKEQARLTGQAFLIRASRQAARLSDSYFRDTIFHFTETLIHGESTELNLQKYFKTLGKKNPRKKCFTSEELQNITENLLTSSLHKTAPLLQLPIWTGAYYADSPLIHDKQGVLQKNNPFTDFAEAVGLLHQYIDDRLDHMGDTEVIGKKTQHDLEQRVINIPTLEALFSKDLTEHEASVIYQTLTLAKGRTPALIAEANALVRKRGIPQLDVMIEVERTSLTNHLITPLTNDPLNQELIEGVVALMIGRNK
ncbi:MAG: polyprenyl synthetase family protein [Nanoarchaeota archaeon]|nr:polyprenyl synthetase family protein [Nanoarchaeota archaeon]